MAVGWLVDECGYCFRSWSFEVRDIGTRLGEWVGLLLWSSEMEVLLEQSVVVAAAVTLRQLTDSNDWHDEVSSAVNEA